VSNPPLIACSLDAQGQRARLAEWADVLRQAVAYEYIADGVRYEFRASEELEARLRELCDLESRCCPFLGFAVARAGEWVVISVTAPPEAQAALRFVFTPPTS
jgi:hypothetical protein